MSNYNQQDKQPLFCKKCGGSGFYYPAAEENTGNWDKFDKWNRLQAFDPKFGVPHWWICPSHPKGLEHRRKIEDDRLIGSGQSTIEKSLDLTPNSAKTSADMDMLFEHLKEIKKLLAILVQRTEPVG